MTSNHTWQGIIGLALIALFAYVVFFYTPGQAQAPATADPTPKELTLSGTYGCLPHKDASGPHTEECAFGVQADDGTWYAVNFGQSAGAMEQFQAGAHIVAHGFSVPQEALSTDHWQRYDIVGIFTITEMISAAPRPDAGAPQGKLDIRAVCESALAYMTFPDAASADTFIAECIDGMHPEVVEQYKAQMGLGDGAAI